MNNKKIIAIVCSVLITICACFVIYKVVTKDQIKTSTELQYNEKTKEYKVKKITIKDDLQVAYNVVTKDYTITETIENEETNE